MGDLVVAPAAGRAVATVTSAYALPQHAQSLRAWDLTAAPLPALPIDDLRAVKAALDRDLTPIDPRQLAVELVRTLRLWRVADAIDDTMVFYVEALEEFPAWAVAGALRQVRLDHRFPTAPTPADFRRVAIALAAPARGAQGRARIALARHARRPSATEQL